jgi:hypothetical protein
LITGEALISVAIAAVIVANPNLIPKSPIDIGWLLALVAVALLIVYLYVRTLGAARRM